ncbi:MAG: L-threonylcarbamoyladenylate synthase, partial [Gammaproteobacteria bacterium]
MNRNFVINAVEVLRAGGLVAMPTETVYGLGADARNVSALRKIFLAKQRPMNHPLIVHLAEISQLEEWADDISETGLLLAKAYWPGPLTLIFKKAPGVNDLVTGGQETIGLRIPHHPVAQALLQAFGGGIAAPSANRFGRISPTTAKAVYEELGDSVDLILEGGQCSVGVESTIVDVSGKHPTILRPGMITAANIEEVLHSRVIDKPQSAPRVSGSMESHYAPATKIRL